MTIKSLSSILLIIAFSVTTYSESSPKEKGIKEEAAPVVKSVAKQDQPKPLPKKPTPAFHEIKDASKLKETFVAFIVPKVQEVNDGILADRSRALKLKEEYCKLNKLNNADEEWLKDLASTHGISNFKATPKHFEELLLRVDMIPASLALAQSACESAWGTSYFARTGNNYFGHMCITPGCGMPLSKAIRTNSSEAKRFTDGFDSVKTYIFNLNSHDAYKKLREIRANLRKNSKPIEGAPLADGLHQYAEAPDYVSKIKAMIRHHKFEQAA